MCPLEQHWLQKLTLPPVVMESPGRGDTDVTNILGSNASSPFSSWVTLLSSFVIYGTRSHMVWMNTSRKDVYLCPCFPLSTFILGQEISRASRHPIFASLRLKEYLRGKKYSHAVIQCYLVSHPVLLSPICSQCKNVLVVTSSQSKVKKQTQIGAFLPLVTS